MKLELLLQKLRDASDEAHPFATAVIDKGALYAAIDRLEDFETARRRDGKIFYIVCALLGFTLAGWYLGRDVAPTVCAPSTMRMQLDPLTIRAAREAPTET